MELYTVVICQVKNESPLVPRERSSRNVALGAAIRAARRKRGLTQEALAFEANLDRSYFGAIERGEFNLTIDTLVKIAHALDMAAWETLKLAGL